MALMKDATGLWANAHLPSLEVGLGTADVEVGEHLVDYSQYAGYLLN